jgi:hypothetical protein
LTPFCLEGPGYPGLDGDSTEQIPGTPPNTNYVRLQAHRAR